MVESDKTSSEMAELIAAITFLFEREVGNECLDMPCLLKILCEYYECTNVKDKFKSELSQTEPKDDEWKMIIDFYLDRDIVITLIDLHLARENHCGPQHSLIMKKHLPKGEKLELLKQLLLNEGIENE